MDFICSRQCFHGGRLWEVGEPRQSDTDLTKPSKKGEKVCWIKKGETTEDAQEGGAKTFKELQKMPVEELILYAKARYRGAKIDPDLPKMTMIKEINIMEKAKLKEEKTGMI